MKNFLFFLLITAASILTQCVTVLPFYTCLFICALIAFYFRLKRIPIRPFYMGALSGFLIATGMTLFFHTLYRGQILVQTADILKINLVTLFLIIGLLSAVLTGLSCFIGYSLVINKEEQQVNG
jgi:hypothetical protein